MDVYTSLYINIPQEEGITTLCNAYETFYKNSPPIPTRFIREILQHLKRKLFPIKSPWQGKHYGHKNGGAFCQYLHERDRQKSDKKKSCA